MVRQAIYNYVGAAMSRPVSRDEHIMLLFFLAILLSSPTIIP